MRRALFAVACVAACGNDIGAPEAPPADAAGEHALEMSDVSILLPLPSDVTQPVLTTIAGASHAIVDLDTFQYTVLGPGNMADKVGPQFSYPMMQVVALRFDVCDRSAIGPCAGAPGTQDGTLRVILQPLYTAADGSVAAEDIAMHTFFPIPAADVPHVITELRHLSALQQTPAGSPLGVSTAATAALAGGSASYLNKLRDIVLTYARVDHLQKMTVAGQIENAGGFEWVFRGFTFDNGQDPQLIVPPQSGGTGQTTLLAGGDIVYNTDPVADVPAGFANAIDGVLFDPLSAADKATAVATLAEVQNPTLHDAVDTQCVACHITTYLTPFRANEIGVAVSALPNTYQTTFNTTVATIAGQDARVVRAFGWVSKVPSISQRVANDTAQVLGDIQRLYP
nr:hypothetical protein [Kofleriaceae bacterium]